MYKTVLLLIFLSLCATESPGGLKLKLGWVSLAGFPGQLIGVLVLLSRDILYFKRITFPDACGYAARHFLQIGILDLIDAVHLPDEELAVRMYDQIFPAHFQGGFQSDQQTVILRHVIRHVPQSAIRFVEHTFILIAENNSAGPRPRVAPGTSININIDTFLRFTGRRGFGWRRGNRLLDSQHGRY